MIACLAAKYCKILTDTHINLYDAGHIKFVKHADDKDSHFLWSAIKAEMRKSVSYLCHVKLDSQGSVLEAQCECTAGLGPAAHCKHVLATLYALQTFITSGTITLLKTCTSRLQTHHHPATQYTGTPIAACDLELGKNIRPPTDPRPLRFRKQCDCQSRVNNMVITFSRTQTASTPLVQTIPPANPFAIDKDHTYTERSYFDCRIDSINYVTPQEAESLEKKTRQQARSSLWRESRSTRLTSSTFGRICKRTDRTDDAKLAASMMPRPNLGRVLAIGYGVANEANAIVRYTQETKDNVQRSGLVVNPKWPMLAASPDGVVDSDTIIEVKCPHSAKDKPINPRTVPYLTEQNGTLTLKTNHYYYYQVQGQLAITDSKTCHFIVFTQIDIKIINITRDDEFIRSMLENLLSFYQTHYRKRILDRYIIRKYDLIQCHHKSSCP